MRWRPGKLAIGTFTVGIGMGLRSLTQALVFLIIARTLGADGVVIGCLRQDGTIDEETVTRLVEAAGPLDITFHRAFDMARDLPEAMETIIRLGVGRILTSGGKPDAPAGADVIGALVRQAAGRVSLMPGGGLTPANLGEVVRRTGAHEVHLSARGAVASAMRFRNPGCAMGTFSGTDEYSWRQTDAASVRAATSCASPSTLIPSAGRSRSFGHVSEVFCTQNDTSGGSSDTGTNVLAARPTRTPSTSAATATTPVGK